MFYVPDTILTDLDCVSVLIPAGVSTFLRYLPVVPG